MSDKYSNIESILAYFLSVVILVLCWFWPNYIYFKKRKWVFQDDKDVTICKNCNNKVLITEPTCPCCKFKREGLKEKKNVEKTFVCDNCESRVSETAKKCPNCGEIFEEEIEKKQDKELSIDQKYSDLTKLKELLDNKIITKSEYDSEKKKVLNRK